LEQEYEVHTAPFGWYKEFEIHVKGHPLAELSRQITIHEDEGDSREDVVNDIESEYYILTPEGEEKKLDLEEPELDSVEDENLRKFIQSEEVKGQPKDKPPSIKAMQQLELIDYEPASDSGHFRFYPKGSLIFDLIKEWADEIALDRLDCIEI
ncbi:MAG: threonyl-tRNA synthetase editing domain-containing protein, partial [Candidatus Aenigmatarchaeota archaeon]